MRRKKLIFITGFVLLAAALSGCRTVSYYSQAIGGQFDIFRAQRPIEKMLVEERTPRKLKEKFELVLELRRFAEKELRLPIDDHYVRYADLHRENVVWNVHAAPEFSMEPKSWWYPFVGKAKYRGYFKEKDARRYADYLKKQGYDVYFDGVEAYSTLGWFKDPLLNTFIFNPDTRLAETIFHELAHQRFFVSGDTDFNEAFATAVAEDALRRWFESHQDPEAYQKYLQRTRRKEGFVRLVKETRAKLKEIFPTDVELVKTMNESDIAALRSKKQQIIADMRAKYEKLKVEWGTSGYDEWFAGPLNNAQLNTVAAYYDLVPGFHALLQANDGNLEKFYTAVDQLSKLPKKERHAKLKSYLPDDAMVAQK